MMLSVMFDWNWPSGSWEEDKNMKRLQREQQRQITEIFDQKSSLEPYWAKNWNGN